LDEISFNNKTSSKEMVMKKVSVLSALVVLGFLSAGQVQAEVTKSQRALVVVSEMDSDGIPELHDVYSALEVATAEVPRRILSIQYGQVIVLKNQQATLVNFRQTLRNLAGLSHIKAIDVIRWEHRDPAQ